METAILAAFGAVVLLCVLSGVSIIYALLFGYVLFFGYALARKHSCKSILKMSWTGIRTIKNILIVFCLIGALTSVWRMSGTISLFIYSCSKLIVPSVFVLIAFLINCAISVLTGTSFGAAATIGVICMSIGNVIGINGVVMGGAILSGAYFGDRCSPMSTSALLVCEVTKTNIYSNIKGMVRTCAVPFAATCLIYLLAGLGGKGSAPTLAMLELFPRHYSLHWTTVLPAALIILLSLCKVNVKWTMLSSVVTGVVICIVVQEQQMKDILISMVVGYRAPDAQLAAMMNGGGILSMVRTAIILCISCSYAGIFEETGFLVKQKSTLMKLSTKISPYSCVLLTSTITAVISCNQSLAIILTEQLCNDIMEDPGQLAVALEDSAVIVPPLIPWSVASAVPIASIGAPTSCILMACFLYLLPLWRVVQSTWGKKTPLPAAQ